MLEGNHTLLTLDLGWNRIKDVRALAHGLSANATLTELSLAWNGLQDGVKLRRGHGSSQRCMPIPEMHKAAQQ